MEAQRTKYELEERIAVGGMAEVFRARVMGAAGFAKVVAVKRILPECSAESDFVKRFIDEARLTAVLQHPNICQVLDFGMMDDRYFIAMEHVDGLDMSRALTMLDRTGEALDADLCLWVLAKVLRGLDHAHRATDERGRPLRLVHRDVSPQNVLISVDGEVKLSDFGAATARAELREAHTVAKVAFGKLRYMAPEQRQGQPVDVRTDVFGAGALLAEAILGSRVFRRAAGASPTSEAVLAVPAHRRFGEVGARVMGIVTTATDPAPDRRFRDATAMLDEVEACLDAVARAQPADRLGALVKRLRSAREADRVAPKPQPRLARVETLAVSLRHDVAEATEARATESPVSSPEGGAAVSSGGRGIRDSAESLEATLVRDRPAPRPPAQRFVSPEDAATLIRDPRRSPWSDADAVWPEVPPVEPPAVPGSPSVQHGGSATAAGADSGHDDLADTIPDEPRAAASRFGSPSDTIPDDAFAASVQRDYGAQPHAAGQGQGGPPVGARDPRVGVGPLPLAATAAGASAGAAQNAAAPRVDSTGVLRPPAERVRRSVVGRLAPWLVLAAVVVAAVGTLLLVWRLR